MPAEPASIPDEQAPAPASGGGRKKLIINIAILAGIMLGEGVGVFFVAKHFAGPPAAAQAAEGGEHGEGQGLKPDEGKKKPEEIELEVVKLRAQNEKAQQMVVYEMTVAVGLLDKDVDVVKSVVERKKATIQDRLSRIVRALDPQRFTEPDLATLRRQFQAELGQILGDEKIVKEVLIPSIVKYSDS